MDKKNLGELARTRSGVSIKDETVITKYARKSENNQTIHATKKLQDVID